MTPLQDTPFHSEKKKGSITNRVGKYFLNRRGRQDRRERDNEFNSI